MNRFDLVRAQSTAQARELAAERPGSLLKAVGIDLDHLKEHLVEPPRLVDLKTIPGLAVIDHAVAVRDFSFVRLERSCREYCV